MNGFDTIWPSQCAVHLQEYEAHIAAQLALLRGWLALEPVAYLDKVDAVWRELCEALLTTRQIFLYLDRTHVVSATPHRSLFDTGLAVLRNHLAANPQVSNVGKLRLSGLEWLLTVQQRVCCSRGVGAG